MIFFMLSGAFRAAGDPRTPLRLGIAMTVLTIAFNVMLIPPFGTVGAAYRARWRAARRGALRALAPDASRLGDSLRARHEPAPDFTIIRSLFRFGLPTGVQGIAMNVGGVLLLRFIGSLEESAAAQAAYAVGTPSCSR
jgi:Na+-driven multidrug efflux pump